MASNTEHPAEDKTGYFIATVLKGLDENAHWALIIYAKDSSKCRMFHFAEDMQNPNNPNMVYRFEYDRGVDEPDLFGRIIHQKTDSEGSDKAETVLNAFGISWIGEGNCQNW